MWKNKSFIEKDVLAMRMADDRKNIVTRGLSFKVFYEQLQKILDDKLKN